MSDLQYRKALEHISPYKPAKTLVKIKEELGLEHIIRLAANENTMGCSPHVQEAVNAALKDIYLYPDGFCHDLRAQLAQTCHFDPHQLIFSNGSFELISLIAQAFLNPGEESIIPEPSFGWYKVVTLGMDGVVNNVPLKNHCIDLQRIQREINDKTRIIWLCNPNNPTGTFFTQSQLESFIADIPPQIIIVLDEAYYEFVTDKSYPDSVSLIEKHPNIIVLRTFSKVYGLASFRLGYGIAGQNIIGNLNKIRLPINVNYLAQIAGIAALSDREFTKAVLDNNAREKQYYYQVFKEMSLDYIPSETNFIMVNAERSSEAVVDEILKKGISVRAGMEFGMPSWLRITIGQPEENRLLVTALKEALPK